MTAIWDKAFLKQRERDALAAQSDDDWESAILRFERGMSNVAGGFRACQLAKCRRARRCVGNKPVCMPRCTLELEPGAEQELIDEFYAEIQQERRDAAAQDRAPRVIRAMPHRVHEEGAVVDKPPPAPIVSADIERNMRMIEETLQRDAAARAAAQRQLQKFEPVAAPQPQLQKPEPVAARPAAPAPPEPPRTSPPDVEERVNAIWAEYVESPEEFSARRRGPRIRML